MAQPRPITTVVRENERFVVMAADSLRRELSRLLPSRTAVVAEGGGWSAVLPGGPVHGDAERLDGAIDDLIDALSRDTTLGAASGALASA